ncbi:MAG: hypothetical protein COA79_18500 [Planctomycetota bacterium]|nr:MAG: hypothetical protein COA79_18500 [Planctomycetota bacterium]
MNNNENISLMDIKWERHPVNPVLPPIKKSDYDCGCCMNPFAVVDDDVVRLFYAGADADGNRRICLATAPLSDLTDWKRHGPLFECGAEGSFDDKWCVLPCVHKFGNRWHLYYSGLESSEGLGLQAFPGIGLAVSDDGVNFSRYSDDPVITGDAISEYPNNRGIAGGGTILEDIQEDGSIVYRMYYTLAVGKPNKDMRKDQEKHCAVCFSRDGITWTDHSIVMSPRAEVMREDAAVAAPYVWRDSSGLYRMIYCPIGTQWGFYSLAQAVSKDGFNWYRGETDQNIVLTPDTSNPDSWEHQMVEYPCVLQTEKGLTLFYCGNGYGSTGIGVATAECK